MPPNKVNLSWCSILHCSRLFRAQLLLGALFFYCGYHAEKWRAHERRWVLSAAVPLWPRVRDTEQSPRRSHDFPLLHLEKQLVDEVYHVQPWRELNSFQLNSPFRAPQHSIHDYTLKAPAWQDGADESRGNSNPIIGTDLRKKSGPRKAAAMLLGKPDMTWYDNCWPASESMIVSRKPSQNTPYFWLINESTLRRHQGRGRGRTMVDLAPRWKWKMARGGKSRPCWWCWPFWGLQLGSFEHDFCPEITWKNQPDKHVATLNLVTVTPGDLTHRNFPSASCCFPFPGWNRSTFWKRSMALLILARTGGYTIWEHPASVLG